MTRHAYVSEALSVLKASLDLSGDILDVGVQESTPTLQRAFASNRHILFEPVAEYHDEIRRRYSGHDFLLFGEAVSDTQGSTFLRPVRQTRGEQISHSYLVEADAEGNRPIRTTTIDAVVASEGLSPSLLKIDVEGPDIPTRILAGARETLIKVPAVLIEMTVPKFAERHAALCETHALWDLCDLSYYGSVLWQFDALYVHHGLLRSTPSLSPMTDKAPFDAKLWQAGFEPGMQ